jgi:uncharacterized RDD family membrane protein YckC
LPLPAMSTAAQPPVAPRAVHDAGVFRRLAAACYDGLLVVAVWMLATLAIVALRGGQAVPVGQLGYQLLLLGATALYFIFSWLRGGQTVGMRAWRLRVERESGEPLDLRTGIVRFAGGLVSILTGGLGLLWLWIDRDELTWHDRLAGTRVLVLSKQLP